MIVENNLPNEAILRSPETFAKTEKCQFGVLVGSTGYVHICTYTHM